MCTDESSTELQASIIQHGLLKAPLPPIAAGVEQASTSISVFLHENPFTWNEVSIPLYSALRAWPLSVGLEWMVNPLLGMFTLLLSWSILKKIFPQNKLYPFIGVFCMGLSPQFIFMNMTVYSMPGALFFNTLWLYLYLQTGRLKYLMPWVGALAIGCHQPFMHALFAIPFLVWLLISRRWLFTIYTGLVYLLGSTLWFLVWSYLRKDIIQDIHSLSNFNLALAPLFQILNWNLLVDWMPVFMGILFICGIYYFFRLSRMLQLLATSFVITFIFYFIQSYQGHGWGNRYFYPSLLAWVAVALGGLEALSKKFNSNNILYQYLFVAGISLLVMLPIRAWQVRSFAMPYASAYHDLVKMDADYVLIDGKDAWYVQDFVRNDPFYNEGPWKLHKDMLKPETIEKLKLNYRVVEVSPSFYAKYGIHLHKPQAIPSESK